MHWVWFVGEEWVVVGVTVVIFVVVAVGCFSLDHECADTVVLDHVVEPGDDCEDGGGGCVQTES